MPQRTCGTAGCPNAHRARGLCSSCYNRQHQHQPRRHATTCHVCGKAVAKYRSGKRRPVCSDYCRWFLQNPVLSCPVPITHPAHPEYQRPARRPAPQLPPRLWTAGRCKRCAVPFVDRQRDARFCSVRCGRRWWRDQYKGSVSHATRMYVLERDGWRCQICKRGIPALLSVPHHMAGTVDHVVPQSQGGTHEPANLRAAHFICNTVRNNGGGNEQLALIG